MDFYIGNCEKYASFWVVSVPKGSKGVKVSMIHRWSKSIMNQATLNQQPLAPTSQHWRLIPFSMGKKTWTKLATLGHVSTEEATWREVYEKKEPSLNAWSCLLFWIFLRATISASRNHPNYSCLLEVGYIHRFGSVTITLKKTYWSWSKTLKTVEICQWKVVSYAVLYQVFKVFAFLQFHQDFCCFIPSNSNKGHLCPNDLPTVGLISYLDLFLRYRRCTHAGKLE